MPFQESRNKVLKKIQILYVHISLLGCGILCTLYFVPVVCCSYLTPQFDESAWARLGMELDTAPDLWLAHSEKMSEMFLGVKRIYIGS